MLKSHLPRWIYTSWLGQRVSATAVSIIVITFVLRLLAIPLAIQRINPYSQADARVFAHVAATISQRFLTGSVLTEPIFPADGIVNIHQLWGLFLSPFWILPGPSAVYARIGMACLGTLAVYNIFAIARYYHSPIAGVVAALPVTVYPSFVLVQSSLLREAAVLASITTAARLFIISPQFLDGRRLSRGALAIGALVFASLLRFENIPIYLLALGIGIGVRYIQRHELNKAQTLLIGVIVGPIVALAVIIAPRVVDYLAGIHRRRTRGRTAYLVETVPTTVLEAVAFVPVGAAYFLFTPFPWMIENIMDVVVTIEALGNMVFFVASISGVRYALRRSTPKTIALIISFLAASALYGIASANVGTVVRQRQMFIWVVYLFGAIGFMCWIEGSRFMNYDRVSD